MTSRVTILSLIRSLGYCCEWRFFTLYKQTWLISFRLGVSKRAVKYRKALFWEGKLKCLDCDKCWRKRKFTEPKLHTPRELSDTLRRAQQDPTSKA